MFYEGESKAAVVAMKIKKRALSRIAGMGGVFCEIHGAQGSRKTSAAKKMMEWCYDKHRDNEYYIMRETKFKECQWQNMKMPFQILIQDGLRIFFVKSYVKENRLEYFTPSNVQYFSNEIELMRIIKRSPGILNVLYLADETLWENIFLQLPALKPRWVNILMDEYGDVFPMNAPGPLWHFVERCQNHIKHCRKENVNIFATAHGNEVDQRIRQEITIFGYARGARKDKFSPVKDAAIRALQEGEMWFDYMHTDYGRFKAIPYYKLPPNPISTIALSKEEYDAISN